MCLNGEKLADTIKEEGKLTGPESDKLLTECSQLDASGPIRRKARDYLKILLKKRGVGHLLNTNE
jgi:hypothetical protein